WRTIDALLIDAINRCLRIYNGQKNYKKNNRE
ncbi:MAG: hypothetical protein ACI8V9_000240, partial [Flavobacteriaceae bacterium]